MKERSALTPLVGVLHEVSLNLARIKGAFRRAVPGYRPSRIKSKRLKARLHRELQH